MVEWDRFGGICRGTSTLDAIQKGELEVRQLDGVGTSRPKDGFRVPLKKLMLFSKLRKFTYKKDFSNKVGGI